MYPVSVLYPKPGIEDGDGYLPVPCELFAMLNMFFVATEKKTKPNTCLPRAWP